MEMEFCGNPVCEIAPPQFVGVIEEVDFCRSSFQNIARCHCNRGGGSGDGVLW